MGFFLITMMLSAIKISLFVHFLFIFRVVKALNTDKNAVNLININDIFGIMLRIY